MSDEHNEITKPLLPNTVDQQPAPTKWMTNKTKAYLKRTLFGFMSGTFLSYLLFFLMVNQMNYSLIRATWTASILLVLLSIGLAFSEHVQCITLLALPQFFTKRGRTLLITYVFVITLSGPMANVTRNTEVLMASLSCGQAQLKSALKDIVTVIKQPFVAIKTAIKHILKCIERVLLKVRKMLIRVKKLLARILRTIRNAFAWLASIVNVCNVHIGTPFQRCHRMFELAREDCRHKLNPWLWPLCNVTDVAKRLCYAVRFVDYVCVLLDHVSDSVVDVVRRRMEIFTNEIRQIFYVSVHFQHSFHFETNASKSFAEIKYDIMDDIRERSAGVRAVASWMQFMSGLFFVWLVARILRYKSRFLRDSRFDNFYLTAEFYAIDERRREMGQQTALPLTWLETRKYVPLHSWWLIRTERLKLAGSLSFLLIATVQIASMLLCDYSLYWLLALIRFHGRQQAGIETEPLLQFSVTGQGMIAELYSGILEVFRPFTNRFAVDPTPCLPDPYRPDFDRYWKIAGYLVMGWLLAIFEPYGLRLRQIVMMRFYPIETRTRAAWLCNHLIRRRGSFVTFARRQARRRLFKDKAIEAVSCLDYLRAKTTHIWLCRKLLGKGVQDYCMLCGMDLSKVSADGVGQCVQWNCAARYCADCFRRLEGSCAMCMQPADYGDMSDVSEELGSTSEDSEAKFDEEIGLVSGQRKR